MFYLTTPQSVAIPNTSNNKIVIVGIKNNKAAINNLVFKWPVAFFMVSSSLEIIALVNSIPLSTMTARGPKILKYFNILSSNHATESSSEVLPNNELQVSFFCEYILLKFLI